MKKKLTKKKKKQAQNKPPIQPVKKVELGGEKKLKTFLGMAIALFAFILYIQSIGHGYTLDDHKVIDKNSVVTKGIAGIPDILMTDYWYGSGHDELRGPVYRPAPLIIFAGAWEFFPDNPGIYHFINILLYALSCFLLFLLLCKLFNKQGILLSFICCLLYAAHPIHTEVVNNIKSLDEILCFLFAIVSISFMVKYVSTKSTRAFIFGGLGFFLSLLSKETGIAFLLIIPLAVYFFTNYSKKTIISVSVLLVIITALWLLIRVLVFKDLHRDIITAISPLNNTLYAASNISSRYATAFYILLRYVGLLFFPHPLSCDYNYAQIKIHTLNDLASLLAIIFYVGIGIYSVINFKNKNVVAFGILFFLISIAPVSNIFFLGGSSMAERFLYIPSFGFCLILAHFLVKLAKTEGIKQGLINPLKKISASPALFLFVVGITVLYSFKIFSRNKDWKDTLTIFSNDIRVSQNSATANELLGNALVLQCAQSPIQKDRLDTFNLAKKYLKRALEIAPGFFDASSNLGYIYLVENKADSAYLYLKEGIKNGPNDIQLNYYFGSASLVLKKFDEAINALSHAVSLNPKYEDAYMKLAFSYSGKGDLDKGLLNYSQVIELDPQNASAYYYSGAILKLKGDTVRSKEFFAKAASLGYGSK